ncbi:MAG: helix-hairpin-helix domain-containing protein [Gemmataceae bacterium]
MTWLTVLTSLFVLFLLTVLVGELVLYLRFRNSAEKRWAIRVINLFHDTIRCVRMDNRHLRELKADQKTLAQALRDEAFAAHLHDVSVDELAAYPGIGPGTLGKLRAAGFVNLATLQRTHIDIPGLGQKRLADIHRAIRQLLNKARSTFDAGSGRQARALAAQLETLAVHYHRLEESSRTRVQAAQEILDRLGTTVEYARTVKFRRWLRRSSKEVLIPAEVMAAALPDLETALRQTKQRIAQKETANQHLMTASFAPPYPAAVPVASHTANNVSPATPQPALATSPPESAEPSRDDWLSLLEIPVEALLSADLVRRQWNLLSERFAPEKVASLGPEFVQLAQTKIVALRRAAEALLTAMGEKLETEAPAPPIQDPRHNPDLDDAFGGM